MSQELLTVVISLIGVVISALSSLSLVNWRLKSLEEKVEKHNSLNDTIKEQSIDIALMQKDIQYIKESLHK